MSDVSLKELLELLRKRPNLFDNIYDVLNPNSYIDDEEAWFNNFARIFEAFVAGLRTLRNDFPSGCYDDYCDVHYNEKEIKEWLVRLDSALKGDTKT